MSADGPLSFAALDAAWETIVAGGDLASIQSVDGGTVELLVAAGACYAPAPVAIPALPTHAPSPITHAKGVNPVSLPVNGKRTLESMRTRQRRWPAWLSAAALLAVTIAAIIAVALRSNDRGAVSPATNVPTAVSAPAGAGWTGTRGGLGRTGSTSDPGPLSQPAIVWQSDELGMLPPVASGDVLVSINGTGILEGFDLHDGRLLWQNDLDLSCAFSNTWCNGLTAEGDRVAFASLKGVVGVADARTGTLQWQQPVPDISAAGGPLVVEGKLFVSTADGGLRSFDFATGTPGWVRTDSLSGDAWHHGALAYEDGLIFSAFSDGTVTATRAATGELVWSVPLTFLSAGSDVITGNGPSTPVVYDGLVYVTGADAKRFWQGALVALDAETGKTVWQFSATEPTTAVSGPALAFGQIYIGGQDGLLYALDPKTGEVRWSLPLPTKLNMAPTVGGDTLFLSMPSRDLLAVDARTGALRWTLAGAGQLSGGPVVIGDSIYGATGDGPLVAIRVPEAATPTP